MRERDECLAVEKGRLVEREGRRGGGKRVQHDWLSPGRELKGRILKHSRESNVFSFSFPVFLFCFYYFRVCGGVSFFFF